MVEKIFGLDLEKLFEITNADAKKILEAAREEVEKGTIGYGLFMGVK